MPSFAVHNPSSRALEPELDLKLAEPVELVEPEGPGEPVVPEKLVGLEKPGRLEEPEKFEKPGPVEPVELGTFGVFATFGVFVIGYGLKFEAYSVPGVTVWSAFAVHLRASAKKAFQ